MNISVHALLCTLFFVSLCGMQEGKFLSSVSSDASSARAEWMPAGVVEEHPCDNTMIQDFLGIPRKIKRDYPSAAMFAEQVECSIHIKDPSGAVLHTLNGHTGFIVSVAWSLGNTMLATASCDSTVRIWNPATGQEMLVLPGCDGENMFSVAWSPDNRYLAIGSDQGRIYVWEINHNTNLGAVSAELKSALYGRPSVVARVSWSVEGSRIASFSTNVCTNAMLIDVWGAKRGELLCTLVEVEDMNELFWLTDNMIGVQLADSQGSIHVWDTQKRNIRYAFQCEQPVSLNSMSFSSDGKKFSAHTLDETYTWDVPVSELYALDSQELAVIKRVIDIQSVIGLHEEELAVFQALPLEWQEILSQRFNLQR